MLAIRAAVAFAELGFWPVTRTITGSLAVIEHLMDNAPAGGAYTPSKLVGADLVTRLPGSGSLNID